MKEIRITPCPQLLGYSFEVRMIDRDARSFATGLTMQTVDHNYAEHIPQLFSMTKQELQVLMDELWTNGVRPSNGSGDHNAFEAVRYHLEDMRRLVFKGKA